MKLMTAARAIHSRIECREWTGRAPTIAVETREGTHDRYAIALGVPAGQSSDAICARAAHELLTYRVFPDSRMRHFVCTPDQEVKAGATIVQRVLLGPLAIEMAVRVVDVFDRRAHDREIGFAYVTLEGHMERGIATFFIRQSPRGDVTFNIESWSRPGNWLVALARPVARLVQKRFTAKALANFATQLQASS